MTNNFTRRVLIAIAIAGVCYGNPASQRRWAAAAVARSDADSTSSVAYFDQQNSTLALSDIPFVDESDVVWIPFPTAAQNNVPAKKKRRAAQGIKDNAGGEIPETSNAAGGSGTSTAVVGGNSPGSFPDTRIGTSNLSEEDTAAPTDEQLGDSGPGNAAAETPNISKDDAAGNVPFSQQGDESEPEEATAGPSNKTEMQTNFLVTVSRSRSGSMAIRRVRMAFNKCLCLGGEAHSPMARGLQRTDRGSLLSKYQAAIKGNATQPGTPTSSEPIRLRRRAQGSASSGSGALDFPRSSPVATSLIESSSSGSAPLSTVPEDKGDESDEPTHKLCLNELGYVVENKEGERTIQQIADQPNMQYFTVIRQESGVWPGMLHLFAQDQSTAMRTSNASVEGIRHEDLQGIVDWLQKGAGELKAIVAELSENSIKMVFTLSSTYWSALIQGQEFDWSETPPDLKSAYLELFGLMRSKFDSINESLAQRFKEKFPESPGMQQAYLDWTSRHFDTMVSHCQNSITNVQGTSKQQRKRASSSSAPSDFETHQPDGTTADWIPGRITTDSDGFPVFHPLQDYQVSSAPTSSSSQDVTQ